MDNLTKEQRQYNMRRIKAKDTKPEMIIRKFLFSKGLRYRLYEKSIPGKPDIVLKKYRTVIFVHGCFWHGHVGCKYAVMPKTNQEYWECKIRRNKERDAEVLQKMHELMWNVVIVWECELRRNKRQRTLERIYYEIIFGSGPNNFNMEQTIYSSSRLVKSLLSMEEKEEK